MLFSYRALDLNGHCLSGKMEAEHAADLQNRLHALHLDLIRCHPARLWHGLQAGPLPRRDLIHFCFHLEQLSRAGVPLLDGLADLRDAIEQKPLSSSISKLISHIEGGMTLSQAMREQSRLFPPVVVNLIAAGEQSGQLPEVLSKLEANLKWEDEISAQTRKLLLYPAFVGSVILAVSLFLMVFLVPQLKLFAKNMGQALPMQSRLLFKLADLTQAYGPSLLATLLLVALAGTLAVAQRPDWQYRVDACKLRLPIIGPILQKIILARFANLFAMLYAAGIPVLDALHATRRTVGNRCIEQALGEAVQGIENGHSMHDTFRDSGLFPALTLRMLRIGESTGQLDLALSNLAYYYERDIKAGISRLQALIEPVITLFMGILLGWIMLAVIGPIYDIISHSRF